MNLYDISIESLVVSSLRKTVWIDAATFLANYKRVCERANVLALYGQAESMIQHLHATGRLRVRTIDGVKKARLK